MRVAAARPIRVIVIGPPDLLVTSIVAALSAAGLEVSRLPRHDTVDPLVDDPLVDDLGGSVLLVDVDHPHADLVIRYARKRGAPVLALGADADRERAASAIVAGAAAWVRTSSPLTSLVEMVRAAATGRLAMSVEARANWSAVHHDSLETLVAGAARLDRLSPREREVLELLVDGNRANAIAEGLVLGIATVRTHINKILRKLDVHSQDEAVELHREVARRRGQLAVGRRAAG